MPFGSVSKIVDALKETFLDLGAGAGSVSLFTQDHNLIVLGAGAGAGLGLMEALLKWKRSSRGGTGPTYQSLRFIVQAMPESKSGLNAAIADDLKTIGVVLVLASFVLFAPSVVRSVVVGLGLALWFSAVAMGILETSNQMRPPRARGKGVV